MDLRFVHHFVSLNVFGRYYEWYPETPNPLTTYATDCALYYFDEAVICHASSRNSSSNPDPHVTVTAYGGSASLSYIANLRY